MGAAALPHVGINDRDPLLIECHMSDGKLDLSRQIIVRPIEKVKGADVSFSKYSLVH